MGGLRYESVRTTKLRKQNGQNGQNGPQVVSYVFMQGMNFSFPAPESLQGVATQAEQPDELQPCTSTLVYHPIHVTNEALKNAERTALRKKAQQYSLLQVWEQKNNRPWAMTQR